MPGYRRVYDLCRLTEREKTALTLRRSGNTVRQIAEIMNLTEAKVYAALHRAVEKERAR